MSIDLKLTPATAVTHSAFWDDLAQDLQDPEFLREYIAESVRIATIDALVNALDEARAAAGLSKADLARAINQSPAAIRRLFSQEHPNPTLGTLAEVAAVLGMRVTLEPLPAREKAVVTTPLREGAIPASKRAAAEQLHNMRSQRRERVLV